MQRLLGGLLCLLCLYCMVVQTVQANETGTIKPNLILSSEEVVRLRHEKFGTFDIKIAPALAANDYFGNTYQYGHTIWYSRYQKVQASRYYPSLALHGCKKYWENPSCKVVFTGVYVIFMDNLQFGLIVLPESGWTYTIPN